MSNLVFVDCEAVPPSPYSGYLTEFGAVTMKSASFHGIVVQSKPSKDNPAVSERIYINKEQYEEKIN